MFDPEGRGSAAALFLEGKLMQTATTLQNYLYKLIEIEETTGNRQEAEQIADLAEQIISLCGMWKYGGVVPASVACFISERQRREYRG